MWRVFAVLLAACGSKAAPPPTHPVPPPEIRAAPAMGLATSWALALEHADAPERQRIFAEAKRHPELIPEIVGLLAVRPPMTRGVWHDPRPLLVELLVSFGAAAVPALTGALEAPDPDTAHLAAEALARIGPDAMEAKPVLLRFLRDTAPESLSLRVDCVRALVALGPDAAEDTLPLLREGLGDADASYRAACARGLSQLASDSAPDAEAVLAAALDGRLPLHWEDTAEGIVGFGPAMAPLLGEVLFLDRAALGRRTRSGWHELATLLGRIAGPEDGRRLLRADDADVQERGVWVARSMAERASPLAIDLLRLFETTRDPNLPYKIAAALGACGPAVDGDVEFFLTKTQRGPAFFEALCWGDADALRLRTLRRRAPAPPPFDDAGLRLWEPVGGAEGEPRLVRSDALLTGFTVWPGTYRRHQVVRALEPLFGTARAPGGRCGVPDGRPENYSSPLWAPQGYAIGGLIVKAGDRVDGLAAVFLRERPDGSLDPFDVRVAPWVGGRAGGPEVLLGADGTPVTGITARSGEDLVALGLVQRAASR